MADILSNLIAASALAVAAAAFVVARRNANAADTSAIEAGRSADASNRSADAAEESARHAQSSAESAAVVARTEIEREHRDLRPVEPEQNLTVDRRNERTKRSNRFFTFTPTRTYRVSGEAIIGASRSPLSLGPVIAGGKPVEAFLDEFEGPQVKAVRILFWPPVAGDPGEQWECPCDRSAIDGKAHWEWYIEIPERHRVMIY